ncbi:MAG: hypothetical protein LBJ60_05200 [Tannerellaceae bacterium]|jgi:hypothetical protein|nr:hypothetical protein [Tannerellaceae bacterium]
MTHLANRDGAFEWMGMINHSGQIGGSYREPVVICDTHICFEPAGTVKKIVLLHSGMPLPFNQKNGWVECTVPRIHDFEMMLCLYD